MHFRTLSPSASDGPARPTSSEEPPSPGGRAVTQTVLTLSGAGVTLFLPWHLLRDQHFQLREVAKHLRTLYDTDHLDDWLQVGQEGDPKMGFRRYGHLFTLYRYRRLVLEARYASRVRGRQGALDGVFAGLLGVGAGSVKKLRINPRRGEPVRRGVGKDSGIFLDTKG
jgi:hypothetical protein